MSLQQLVASALVLSVIAALCNAKQWISDRDCRTHPWPYKLNALEVGQTMEQGQQLATSTATLSISKGGNLVLTRKKDQVQLWTSNTEGTNATTLSLEADGMLHLRTPSGFTVWLSNQNSGKAKMAALQDDCNFVMYSDPPQQGEVWATSTSKCLKFHMVPHSHDDVGWLLTPERYYDGCYAPGGGFRGIMTTIYETLMTDKTKTFSEVEMYFFQRWWQEQNATTKKNVHQLVKTGQLEFINAGWSMHDEACVHQESAIGNMEVGAQFLKEEFGEYLKLNIGWHIDPFGHASTTPRIMAQMGFDAFFFWRTDYQQRQFMIDTKTVESVWSPSPSLGDGVNMFTSIMYDSYCQGCDNNMCPAQFYSFDCEVENEYRDNDEQSRSFHQQQRIKRAAAEHPIFASIAQHTQPKQTKLRSVFKSLGSKITDHKEQLRHSRMSGLAEIYAQTLHKYAQAFRSGQVLIPWGCDFAHVDAQEDYALLDRIMGEINDNYATYGMDLFYSTPSKYVEAVHAMNYSWPLNTYDYFLDSDNGHSYWSGYLSSREEFKGFERFMMNERTSMDIAMSEVKPALFKNLTEEIQRAQDMREAMGIVQHHDSITGTERVHVRNRYQFLVTRAHNEMNGVLNDLIDLHWGTPAVDCILANLSHCSATDPLAGGSNVSVFLFNPLAQTRDEVLTVPVPVAGVSVVRADTGAVLKSQTVSTWELTTTRDKTSPDVTHHKYQTYFQLAMNPIEHVRLILVPSPAAAVEATPMPKHGATTIANEHYSVVFDGTSGRVANVTNLKSGLTSSFEQNLGHYCPHDNVGQASGAYIFRTCDPYERPKFFATSYQNVSVVSGPLCTEVRAVVDAHQNLHQAWRVCKGQDFVELTTGIGEVNAGDTGIEVIMRMKSDFASNSTWFTDSEALEMQKRVKDHRPNYPYTVSEGVAANFFPCNAFSYVNSTDGSGKSLAVVADRSRSTASLEEGELEFLVQRRLIYDDNRGVGQPLDENTRVLSTNRLIVNDKHMVDAMRLNSQHFVHRPLIRYASPSASSRKMTGDVLPPSKTGDLLPKNIHLHTRTLLRPGVLILRLQHLFAVGESDTYSNDVEVDLRSVLPDHIVKNATNLFETDMNGITPLAYINRLDFKFCTGEINAEHGKTVEGTIPPNQLHPDDKLLGTVGAELYWKTKMRPMDIKTFKIVF